MEEKELLKKIALLGDISDDQKKNVVCSLIGHSNIETSFFGYYYCGRCGTQVGDALGGVYNNKKQVIIGHNCDTCQQNYEKLTWEDKLMCPTKDEIFATENDGVKDFIDNTVKNIS